MLHIRKCSIDIAGVLYFGR